MSNDNFFLGQDGVCSSLIKMYFQDLTAMLKDELGGHFEDICVALVTEPLEFDVKTFHMLIEVRKM